MNWLRQCSGSLSMAPGYALYNPRMDVTQDTTTLYASDRDVFLG
jgi:hypothetical protein